MFTKNDIKVGSKLVVYINPNQSIECEVIDIGTEILGEDSFVSRELGDRYPMIRIFSCSDILEILYTP